MVCITGESVPFPDGEAAQGIGRESAALPRTAASDATAAKHGVREKVRYYHVPKHLRVSVSPRLRQN